MNQKKFDPARGGRDCLIVCPACGASAYQDGRRFVCDHCGSVVVADTVDDDLVYRRCLCGYHIWYAYGPGLCADCLQDAD